MAHRLALEEGLYILWIGYAGTRVLLNALVATEGLIVLLLAHLALLELLLVSVNFDEPDCTASN